MYLKPRAVVDSLVEHRIDFLRVEEHLQSDHQIQYSVCNTTILSSISLSVLTMRLNSNANAQLLFEYNIIRCQTKEYFITFATLN